MRKEHLPVSEKFGLTINEASDYFGIGVKNLRHLAELNTEDYAIFNGNRFIIIRPRFEEYLLNCSAEKEELGAPVKKLSIGDKDLVNVDEAVRYYHLSRRKFSRFLDREEDYPFLVYYRKRKLIIRDEFEAYLKKHPEIPFDTVEIVFSDKPAAIAWICRNQLGRRNLTPDQKRYLMGKQYKSEKASPMCMLI